MICGPKGAGKTMCLLALMSELEDKTVFVNSESFKEDLKQLTIEYLRKVAKNAGVNVDTTLDALQLLFMLAKTKKVLLLMDFDDLNDSRIVGYMCKVARYSSHCAVLAMSSGEGCTTDGVCFTLNQEFITLLHLPFTEEEVDCFIRLNNIKFTREKLLPITGHNPLLLSLAATATDQNDLIKKVDHCILRHVYTS